MSEAGLAQPFYFGPQGLFGMYHPAPAQASRGAVLLCAPTGLDQIRTHRLYRQLAQALADAGWCALRFDCYGSGDSPGRSIDVDWQRCCADAVAAAEELRRRSGHAQVAAFGVRLGASLALAVAATAPLAHAVVWDPVLDGGAFVRGMDALQERMRTDPGRFQPPRSVADAAGQWLGFPVSEALRRQLQALQIGAPSIPVDWFQSTPTREGTTHRQYLPPGTAGTLLPGLAPWDDLGGFESTILAPALVKAVVARFGGAA